MTLQLRFALRSVLVTLLAVVGQPSRGADSPHFEQDVLPLLYRRCFACHSEKQAIPQGGLRLDSAAAIRGSDVIVPGRPDDSELLRRVSLPAADDAAMPPPKGGAQPFNDAERATLRRWIADGAKTDGWVKFDHRGAAYPADVASHVSADVRQLASEVQQRIDRWHAGQGTQLNALASDEIFLRRVYLDVVGRIPSLAESTRFLDSCEPDKRAKLIDELLDSEGYVSHAFNWKADLLRLSTRGLAPGQPGKFYDDWVKDAIRSRMPYDKFVRQLVTASGYLWENGAVGFYVRDLGMPLDHLSNMSRVFLGTRIECAQCHDHPLEPVTQQDFYQMAAFTFGVSNLSSPGGYSLDNVRQYPQIKSLLASLEADEGLAQSVSGTIAPLKRLTQDTDNRLIYPESYIYDASLRGQPVEPRTLFGDEIAAVESSIVEGGLRQAFAAWMTSPRNPRFTKNIANRLFKRVMGAGLIEPVDSLSALPNPEHAELLDFLTQIMIRLQFDERAFLAVLLNTRLYQSEAVRETPEPGAVFALRGPQLRRLSAEQIWDSLLVLAVEDVDQRKSNFRLAGLHDPQYLRQLTAMTAEEIIAQARVQQAEHVRRRKFNLRRAEQQQELAAARSRHDEQEVQRLTALHAKENQTLADPDKQPLDPTADSEVASQDADPRWNSLPPHFVRASETPLPLPLGHFLRQFGQSDRREIDAFNRDPNATHSLALMNGDLTVRAIAEHSFVRRRLAASGTAGDRRTQLIYRAILVRSPSTDELSDISQAIGDSPTAEPDLIWALLNSPEFLFNH